MPRSHGKVPPETAVQTACDSNRPYEKGGHVMPSSWLRKCIRERALTDRELMDKMVLDERMDLLGPCKRLYRM